MRITRRGVETRILRTVAGRLSRWTFAEDASWPVRRARAERVARVGRTASGVQLSSRELGGVSFEVASPSDPTADFIVLYLHGGGWAVGSPRTHRPVTTGLAASTGAEVWSIDYRLAPEHPYPAALDDCLAAYAALLDAGHRRIIVAGESAGGQLSVALALAAARDHVESPIALGLICPALDLTTDALALLTDNRREPVINVRMAREMFGAYAANHPRDDPLLSPLLGDLDGLPPIVLDSAADDLLAAQSSRFADQVRAAGGTVDHRCHPGVWHAFHILTGIWPVATQALDEFGGRILHITQAEGSADDRRS
jgi:acetyl esterase/lipase